MKIIKKPTISIATCKYCGCIFQTKYRDLKYSSCSLRKDEVICPFCKGSMNIKFVQEKV